MKRTTIVLVEDDPMSRLVALDALERGGFDVVDFATAAEAVSYAERMPDHIAALATDVHMPGDLDGIDLACSVRARWPEIALLVTSGRFGSERPDDLPAWLSFLPKPWTAKTLMAGLQASLDRGARA